MLEVMKMDEIKFTSSSVWEKRENPSKYWNGQEWNVSFTVEEEKKKLGDLFKNGISWTVWRLQIYFKKKEPWATNLHGKAELGASWMDNRTMSWKPANTGEETAQPCTCLHNLRNLWNIFFPSYAWRMFVQIVSVHPYRVQIHPGMSCIKQANKLNNDRADDHCYNFAWM